jgi:hypothetical protein
MCFASKFSSNNKYKFPAIYKDFLIKKLKFFISLKFNLIIIIIIIFIHVSCLHEKDF